MATSKNHVENGETAASASVEAAEATIAAAPVPQERAPRARTARRRPTLFDAVAGRVTLSSVLDKRDTVRRPQRLGDATLAPEEVLFRAAAAPPRYEEDDFYFAHEALPNHGRDILPESDLLMAVHGYASHFYEAMARRRAREAGEDPGTGRLLRHFDERSMDETALLAFGILLEEAGRQVLGAQGDLVFTEAQEEGAGGAGTQQGTRRSQGRRSDSEDGEQDEEDEEDEDGEVHARRPKKQRR